MRKDFSQDGEALRVQLVHVADDQYKIQVGDRSHDVVAHAQPDGRVVFQMGGQTFEAASVEAGGVTQVRLGGHTWKLQSYKGGAAAATEGTGVVEAPMTGTILQVPVELGQSVEVGDVLVILTAMKMEHKLIADIAGTVSELRAVEGENVDQGTVLVRVDAIEE